MYHIDNQLNEIIPTVCFLFSDEKQIKLLKVR